LFGDQGSCVITWLVTGGIILMSWPHDSTVFGAELQHLQKCCMKVHLLVARASPAARASTLAVIAANGCNHSTQDATAWMQASHMSTVEACNVTQ
jgi:hypothetical protein